MRWKSGSSRKSRIQTLQVQHRVQAVHESLRWFMLSSFSFFSFPCCLRFFIFLFVLFLRVLSVAHLEIFQKWSRRPSLFLFFTLTHWSKTQKTHMQSIKPEENKTSKRQQTKRKRSWHFLMFLSMHPLTENFLAHAHERVSMCGFIFNSYKRKWLHWERKGMGWTWEESAESFFLFWWSVWHTLVIVVWDTFLGKENQENMICLSGIGKTPVSLHTRLLCQYQVIKGCP